MEEYKYAVVSGGVCSDLEYIGTVTLYYNYNTDKTFYKPSPTHRFPADMSELFMNVKGSIYYAFSPNSFNGGTSFNDKDFIINLITEDDYDGVALKYYAGIYITGDLIAEKGYEIWDDNDNHKGYEYMSTDILLSNVSIGVPLYIDFYYPGSSNNYIKYTGDQRKMTYSYKESGSSKHVTFYINITGYSIQNLYGTVLTDRILNTLYT